MYKVLLVDSDAQSKETTERMLEQSQSGFAVQAYADDARSALSYLENRCFSLVLINFKRFQSEGLQLCDQIRQQSRIPIILLGGEHDFNLARKALYYQVSDYLADSFQLSDLAASLQRVKQELDAQTSTDASLITAIQKKRQPRSSIIDVVKKYVHEELHLNITLKKISDVLHFNCAYLGQKFKSEVNMSFNEYLLQQRMEKAKLLLKQTDLRIYEIANEVGYLEIDWFYKKFKAYTGTSANEYRKTASFTA